MKQPTAIASLDYSSLGLMAGFIVFFATTSITSQHVVCVLIALSTSILLWGALRGLWSLTFPVRFVIAALAVGLMWIFGPFPSGRLAIIWFFLALFILFSCKRTRAGSSMRLLCGLFSGVLLSAALPVSIGGVFGVVISLVYVGGLISLWSGMNLYLSLVWFAKRSIRRETVFLILFIAGISSVGLRQAQNYASRQSEISGLSHIISPGSMNQLALSPALAMRVQFREKAPDKPSESYFRGAVMDRSLGFYWAQGPSRLRRATQGESFDFVYDVSLAPRYAEFAPVLDYGVAIQSAIGKGSMAQGRDNGVFFPIERVETWNYYEAKSRLTPLHSLDEDDRVRLLQKSKKIDPRVLELGAQLGNGSSDVKLFTSRLAQYFRAEKFLYTLAPEGDRISLAEFLFVRKSGYCEHYASASAALARVAGIPARVVAGFLGGEWYPRTKTLFVRDLDAHAWTELWDDQSKTWVRFDPVESVAAARITEGSAAYLRLIGANIPDEFSMSEQLWTSYFLMELDNLIATINTGVVNGVAESIIDNGEELAILGLVGLATSFVLIRIQRKKGRQKTRESEYLAALMSALVKRGASKGPGEAAYDWLRRMSVAWPDISADLISFAETHAKYSYSEKRNDQDLLRMKEIVKTVKIKIKASRKKRDMGISDETRQS